MKYIGEMIQLNRRDLEGLDTVLKAINTNAEAVTKKANDEWLQMFQDIDECNYWLMDIRGARELNEHLLNVRDLPLEADNERRVITSMLNVVIPPEFQISPPVARPSTTGPSR